MWIVCTPFPCPRPLVVASRPKNVAASRIAPSGRRTAPGVSPAARRLEGAAGGRRWGQASWATGDDATLSNRETWEEEYVLVSEDVDDVTREIERVRRENAELTSQIEEAVRRQQNQRRENGKAAVKPALSSQTDLSKISQTGLKAYHTLSTKQPMRSKGDDMPPPKQSERERRVKGQLQIVFVSAEVTPYSKAGGLGDVVGSLPFALARRGHRVMIITPRYLNGSTDHVYSAARDAKCDVTLAMGHGGQQRVKYYTERKADVDLVFVDHPCFHRNGNPYGDEGGIFTDNTFRFAILSMAACEAPLHVLCQNPETQQRSIYGEEIVFLANDWHTALIPVYLTSKYRPNGVYQDTSCIMAIHNLAHQGIESPAMFHNLGIPESHYGVMEWVAEDGYISMNLLKGALVTADRIVTVSCMHAFDMMTPKGAMGLHPVLQCRQNDMNGILNGIDLEEWNPETDSYITEQYSFEDLSGKVKCKLRLQREMGFRTSSKTPLIGYVGRLDDQKGPDLVLGAVPWMMANRCQVVMLGTGDAVIEQQIRDTEELYRESFRGCIGFSVPLSHRIIAGCDIILMPSRFEPCGLTQQFALRYGTVPVAHATGGLMDTIEDFSPFGESMGNGFLFRQPDVDHLIRGIDRALDTFRCDKEGWKKLQSGMNKDFGWSRSAASYEKVIETCVLRRQAAHT